MGYWYPSDDVCPGFQSQDGFLACMLSCLCAIPQIHLWCGTCWLYRGQHGNWAFLIHLPADVSVNMGGGSGLEPMTVHAAHSKYGAVNHSATPARLRNFLPNWSWQGVESSLLTGHSRLTLRLNRSFAWSFLLSGAGREWGWPVHPFPVNRITHISETFLVVKQVMLVSIVLCLYHRCFCCPSFP